MRAEGEVEGFVCGHDLCESWSLLQPTLRGREGAAPQGEVGYWFSSP
jgi:hypothetical protein